MNQIRYELIECALFSQRALSENWLSNEDEEAFRYLQD